MEWLGAVSYFLINPYYNFITLDCAIVLLTMVYQIACIG